MDINSKQRCLFSMMTRCGWAFQEAEKFELYRGTQDWSEGEQGLLDGKAKRLFRRIVDDIKSDF